MLILPLQYKIKKQKIMATKNCMDDFMSQKVEAEAWKELSGIFPWTEQLLEKYKDKIDWEEISSNNTMVWTASILEKFQARLDWDTLSRSSNESILTAELFERFKNKWNWSELSGNSDTHLNYELIDRFIDCWDWKKLINRYDYDDKLFGLDFMERYKEYIPGSALQDSRLWMQIVEQCKWQMAIEILTSGMPVNLDILSGHSFMSDILSQLNKE